MTHARWTAALFAILFGFVVDAHAQPSCGGFSKDTWAFQPVPNRRGVEAHASSSRDFSVCPATVQAEVWIGGVGGAAAQNGAFYAEAWVVRTVPSFGTYSASSKHWFIGAGFIWVDMGSGHALADIGGETDDGGVEEREGGTTPEDPPCDTDPTWPGCNSPLILDMAGDGFRLTNASEGVLFDLDADGTPEQVAWTHEGTNDAWLAWDRNGNGAIDSGAELFGNHTPIAPNAENGTVAENGFQALKFTEGPAFGQSFADAVIDNRDAVWPSLLLWRDVNHNGISEPDELQAVTNSSLSAISHAYSETPRRDQHGNEFRLRSSTEWTTSGGTEIRPVFDVWLKRLP